MISLQECLRFITPDFVRHFIDFYSHSTGIILFYFYISCFFWIFFGISVFVIFLALLKGSYHKKRVQKLKKMKYAHEMRKIIKSLRQ
jgi:ABC-type bacteriocin/lantibiotic exporter with double-glycine peptidase domain